MQTPKIQYPGVRNFETRYRDKNKKLKIGFTYDLRSDHVLGGATEEEAAEFEASETVDAISRALESQGYEVDPIGNIFGLVSRLSRSERWDLVFNFAEGQYGLAREAQVPALLDAYQIPYVFSEASVLCTTLNKAQTKEALRSAQVPFADFFVVHTMQDLERMSLTYPLFAKPLAEGSGKGIYENSKIENKDQLYRQCFLLLSKFQQPVLIEEYLPGQEFTVGILGTGEKARVMGVLNVFFNSQAEVDFYSFNNKSYESFYKGKIDYSLLAGEQGTQIGKIALEAWRHLGCRDGGRIDIRLDSRGVPNFIEVNPLPGLRPKYSDMVQIAELSGMTYDQLICDIVQNALLRIEGCEIEPIQSSYDDVANRIDEI